MPLGKASEAYRQNVARMTGSVVDLSPGCCGESGLGAMTTPDLYNRVRQRKMEQLHQDMGESFPTSRPVLVGCPSCKIGVRRCLLGLGRKQQPVLHTLEYLAGLTEGEKWKRTFRRAVGKAALDGRKRVVSLEEPAAPKAP